MTCVVYYKTDLYGPFPDRETADTWITEHVRVTLPQNEMASWEIRRLNVPASAEARAAERALDRVRAEIHDWPAADFWHRDAILRAITGGDECTCGKAWSGHPNPHAATCPEHA